MDRTVPFESETKCDVCGKVGAFDFMGDYYCADCFNASGIDNTEYESDMWDCASGEDLIKFEERMEEQS